MLVLIDNYDSFTYNLVQYFGELGADIRVFRNDQVSLSELMRLNPSHLVISPGPGEPLKDDGISSEAIKHFTGKIPVLGVCLGHQALGAVFGGKVDRAQRLMHGKTSKVNHNGEGIFKNIPSPFEAMRYHSLVVYDPIPDELEVTAFTPEEEIMGLKHKQHHTYGVQFHPESILTEHGKQLLKNFLDLNPAPAKREEDMLKPFIAKTINRTDLSANEAEEAMNVIMTGGATQAQIGAYLVSLRMKGETIDEITGSVRAMRANSVKVKLNANENIYDIVGTGGDGAHTFNISTAAAFVLAGTGRKVAKHGNRAASSHCGSADVLSALGISLELTPEQIAKAIEEIGIGFMFAAKFHPAMKHAIGPRKEIGQRTIFNILGPLTNPAGANIQLTGVFDANLTEPMAYVLKELGSTAAMVIHGANKLDELNTTGINRVSHLKDGAVKTYDLNPNELGFASSTVQDLRGGTPDESAVMMKAILSNKLQGARRDAILLNAAAALAAETGDFKSALNEATASIDSGQALNKLNTLIEYSQSFAQ
ncbi:MAG TPA: bifunctional glutamine amidotransferase/anthranilate phosphoribosyltransferase [Anaerolineae bacterium]|nr:bifunctional glutamine amidotransferase/anthranilate phosphoribosyltransferase [Anaerolineae bacterium]HCK67214.1 bifunctional glutamine amidotransferase/anthranilate phosphoribosyltransferase [Anaerolineae bacterium]